jgi:hypothetical protein
MLTELKFLGNTELMLNNHEDVVPANCVESTPMKSFLYLPHPILSLGTESLDSVTVGLERGTLSDTVGFCFGGIGLWGLWRMESDMAFWTLLDDYYCYLNCFLNIGVRH